MKIKKWNKKGGVPLIIWGVAALVAGIGYLVSALKPAPTGIAAIPIWGWIVGGLVLLILLKK